MVSSPQRVECSRARRRSADDSRDEMHKTESRQTRSDQSDHARDAVARDAVARDASSTRDNPRDMSGRAMSSRDIEARSHLALALDLDDLVAALRIARPLAEYFSVAKVGFELFSAAGPESVVALSRQDSKSSST